MLFDRTFLFENYSPDSNKISSKSQGENSGVKIRDLKKQAEGCSPTDLNKCDFMKRAQAYITNEMGLSLNLGSVPF
jgi:hypothetical protein